MGNNYMRDMFRDSDENKSRNKVVITPETDLDKFNRHLITTANADIDIRQKILMVNKFIETLGEKEV